MPTKIRQPKAELTQVLSDAPASDSDARIANHLAWVLNDPAISQLGNDELVQLVDALISLPSAVAASRATIASDDFPADSHSIGGGESGNPSGCGGST
jgi:hypothetical protein